MKISINIMSIPLLNSSWCPCMILCLIHSSIKVILFSWTLLIYRQVGGEEWKINMVCTCQTDRCGTGSLGKAAVKENAIVIGSHESLLYQHNTKPLTSNQTKREGTK
jgi:hypothetical protein